MGFDKDKVRKINFYKGKGCGYCNNTGYKGRVAITEVMPISRSIRKNIIDGASAASLKKLAQDEGMLTLRDDAWSKVAEGLITVEEVVRETSSL